MQCHCTQWLFQKFILGGGSFYSVFVGDIFVRFLQGFTTPFFYKQVCLAGIKL